MLLRRGKKGDENIPYIQYLYRFKNHINPNLVLSYILQSSHSISHVLQVVDLSPEPLTVIRHELCDFVHALFVLVVDAVTK